MSNITPSGIDAASGQAKQLGNLDVLSVQSGNLSLGGPAPNVTATNATGNLSVKGATGGPLVQIVNPTIAPGVTLVPDGGSTWFATNYTLVYTFAGPGFGPPLGAPDTGETLQSPSTLFTITAGQAFNTSPQISAITLPPGADGVRFYENDPIDGTFLACTDTVGNLIISTFPVIIRRSFVLSPPLTNTTYISGGIGFDSIINPGLSSDTQTSTGSVILTAAVAPGDTAFEVLRVDGPTATVTAPGAQNFSEQWGLQALASDGAATALGFTANATDFGATALGQASDAGNPFNVAVGYGAFATGGPPHTTTIAVGSDGQNLPQTTIFVANTSGFPTSGTILVGTTDHGTQLVQYTGTAPGSFTGCDGGTGLMNTGNQVRAFSSGNMAIGAGATDGNSTFNIVIGGQATVADGSGHSNVLLGTYAYAEGSGNVVIGGGESSSPGTSAPSPQAQVFFSNECVAIGHDVFAGSQGAVVIGSLAVGNGPVTIGQNAFQAGGGVVIGKNCSMGSGPDDGSTVIGNNSQISNNTSGTAILIGGQNTTQGGENTVFLFGNNLTNLDIDGTTLLTNVAIFGGNQSYLKDIYFGAISQNAFTSINGTVTLHSAGGSANVGTTSGIDLALAGGKGFNAATHSGGNVRLQVALDGASHTLVDAIVAQHNGNAITGLATLTTASQDGFLHIPQLPGPPTNPPNVFGGFAPIVLNFGDNNLYSFLNGAWISVSGGVGNRVTGQTAAATIVTFTVGTTDGSFQISSNANITAGTTFNFQIQVAYTDETGTPQTMNLSYTQPSASTYLNVLTDTTGTGPYLGITQEIRCQAGTTITIATAGTFTSVTYNADAVIKQVL